MIRRKIIMIIAIVILIVTLGIVAIIRNTSSKTTETTNELKTISVSEVTRSVFYAPQYVAIAAGYFEEEGLKIDLTTGQGADNVMTAVLSNQVDIGFAGPEASIYVYNEGKEDYTEEDVEFVFNRDIFINEDAKIDNCAKSVGIISNKTILARHPWVTNVEHELAQIEEDKQAELDEMEVTQEIMHKHEPAQKAKPSGGDA
jgi:ABC-type phosphate/phosphonate transport system substrate-binding protein